MRIAFIGASRFGYRCLDAVFNLPSVELCGIITNPSTFSISYRPEGVQNVLHIDFHPFAEKHQIPIFEMNNKMTDSALFETLQGWKPDLILVVGWYHMIPKVIRELAPTLGMHASLLPDYSGGAPLVWAMINGETETGISLFVMDAGVDSGPLVGQARVPILFEDTIATLYARIEEAGLGLLHSEIPRLVDGNAQYTVQDDSLRRIFPQRAPEDGLIDWNWPALEIYNFIRAQTKPYPGAFTWLQGKKITFWHSHLSDGFMDAPIASYVHQKNMLAVTCGDSKVICISALAIEGEDILLSDLPNVIEFKGQFETGPAELPVRFHK